MKKTQERVASRSAAARSFREIRSELYEEAMRLFSDGKADSDEFFKLAECLVDRASSVDQRAMCADRLTSDMNEFLKKKCDAVNVGRKMISREEFNSSPDIVEAKSEQLLVDVTGRLERIKSDLRGAGMFDETVPLTKMLDIAHSAIKHVDEEPAENVSAFRERLARTPS